MSKHTLSVLVENKAGVLARVASLFARRGYNIESLAVAPTDDEAFSRITIVVDVESTPLEQIVKQLFKLIDVVKISELDPRRSVERELLLQLRFRREQGAHGMLALGDLGGKRCRNLHIERLTSGNAR